MIVTHEDRHPLEVRARMALAEAGYPDATVNVHPFGTTVVQEGDFIINGKPSRWNIQYPPGNYATGWDAPLEVIWRAFVVAQVSWMPCWRCWEMELLGLFRSWWHAPCTAIGLGVEDCGAERPR